MSVLYIVATPIGNLEDISKRALRILSEVDLILCEDTRTTQKLLFRYQIKTPTLSYHQHSKMEKSEQIIGFLEAGKNLALVSDAGTPGISDPGNKLISLLVDKFVSSRNLPTYSGAELKNSPSITPVPGPSALAAAASVCGFPMERFLFLGFPPLKKKRKKFFEEIIGSKYPVIFYESPHRIIKTLRELNVFYAKYYFPDTKIVVCRELTKKFETFYRGGIGEVIEKIEKEKPKGEFVVIACPVRNLNHS